MREERPELIQVMDSASKAATGMLRRPTVTALLQVARADNTGKYFYNTFVTYSGIITVSS